MPEKHRSRVTRGFVAVGVVLLAVLASPLQAATLRVANDGTDSAGCGPLADPCRSIGTAIDNAAGGDKIVVGPGLYSQNNEPAGQCGGDCLIEVDKTLTIESTDGAEPTVLDADGLDVVVRITADDVTFGGDGKGFLLVGAADDGLETTGASSRALVRGNISIANGRNGFTVNGDSHEFIDNVAIDNGDDGFDIDARESTFHHCEASCNGANGFVTEADDDVFTRCQADGNGQNGFRLKDNSDRVLVKECASSTNDSDGFDVDGVDHTLFRCVAAGNAEHGFFFKDNSGHTLNQSATLGNEKNGIKTNTTGVTITQNNIYGSEDGNCGLKNSSGAGIVAPSNFWGAATGPGADPADVTCNSTVTTTPVAGSEFGQPYSWLPGGL